MKLILLIAALLIISMASSKVIEVKKSISRSIGDENVALELKFFGTCEEFKARVLPTVWISKGQSCLPIQVNVTQNPDVDDLNAHFFCTHVDNGRSIIHFVEIFETSDATGYPDFVLSLIPSNPFRVLTPKTSLARRPNCHVTHDFCNETNAIVDSCSTNKVRTKERKNKSQYVVSQDRIYITANQQVSNDCKANGNCCAYVAPQEYGGICDHTGSKDLLSFPKKHNDHKDGKKKEGKKEGKKGGNRGGKKVAVNAEEEKKDDNVEKKEDDKVEVQVQKKRPGQGRKGKRPPTNRKGKNRPNSPAVRPPNHRNDRPASHRTSSHRTGSNRPPTRKSRPANNKPVNKKPTQPKEEDDDEEEEDEDKK